MKAVVKSQYAGQDHSLHGRLLAGTIYEVDELGAIFEPYEAPKPFQCIVESDPPKVTPAAEAPAQKRPKGRKE